MVVKDIKFWGFFMMIFYGSKMQEQCEVLFVLVWNGQLSILVVIDLVGCGIDVLDVSLVVNFNMLLSIESYMYCIGCMGCVGKSGVVIMFLGNEDMEVMYDLKQIIFKLSIFKVLDELRRYEVVQSKLQRGQKKVEDSGGFGGKGGWQQSF